MTKCPICGKDILLHCHSLVLCKHHKWFVHLECCKKKCSQHGEPCIHAYKIY